MVEIETAVSHFNKYIEISVAKGTTNHILESLHSVTCSISYTYAYTYILLAIYVQYTRRYNPI